MTKEFNNLLKLAGVKQLNESVDPKEYLSEGVWSYPFTLDKAKKLQALMSAPIKASEATDKLYNLVGNDDLFDVLDDLADEDPNSDIRGAVKQYISDLLRDNAIGMDDGVKEILQGIAKVAEGRKSLESSHFKPTEEYPERKGEWPIRMNDGSVLYYDSDKDEYWDPDLDTYVDHEEYQKRNGMDGLYEEVNHTKYSNAPDIDTYPNDAFTFKSKSSLKNRYVQARMTDNPMANAEQLDESDPHGLRAELEAFLNESEEGSKRKKFQIVDISNAEDLDDGEVIASIEADTTDEAWDKLAQFANNNNLPIETLHIRAVV